MPQFFCCPQLNGSSKREHAVSDLDFLIWTPGGGGTVIHSFFLLLELSCCFNRPAVSIVLLFPSSCCPQLNGSSKRKYAIMEDEQWHDEDGTDGETPGTGHWLKAGPGGQRGTPVDSECVDMCVCFCVSACVLVCLRVCVCVCLCVCVCVAPVDSECVNECAYVCVCVCDPCGQQVRGYVWVCLCV